jgi:hypothetical protein
MRVTKHTYVHCKKSATRSYSLSIPVRQGNHSSCKTSPLAYQEYVGIVLQFSKKKSVFLNLKIKRLVRGEKVAVSFP